uniref:Uncharacterized protein n=1 Tax=Oryza sativa subsp. japonica TaxID=39947 RepID=Q67UP7_ORYSJ|nr:hypothetical protein [Oryza sativa Japonica Group]
MGKGFGSTPRAESNGGEPGRRALRAHLRTHRCRLAASGASARLPASEAPSPRRRARRRAWWQEPWAALLVVASRDSAGRHHPDADGQPPPRCLWPCMLGSPWEKE